MTSEPYCPEPTPDGGWENSPGGVTGHPPTDRRAEEIRLWAKSAEFWEQRYRTQHGTVHRLEDELAAARAEVVALRERAEEAEAELGRALDAFNASCAETDRYDAQLAAALGREAKLREALTCARRVHERLGAWVAEEDVQMPSNVVSALLGLGNWIDALAGADTPPPPDTPTRAPANNAGAGKETP